MIGLCTPILRGNLSFVQDVESGGLLGDALVPGPQALASAAAKVVRR